MKSWHWRNTFATTALAAGTLATVSLAGVGASAAPGASPTTTFHFVERGGGVRFIDSAPPRARGPFDFSPGDQAIVTRTLESTDGSRAGSLQLACTAITGTRQHCTGTVTLRGGTLEVAGVSSPSPTTVVAVVGGTGTYTRQTGTGYAKDRPGHSDVADLTITLGG